MSHAKLAPHELARLERARIDEALYQLSRQYGRVILLVDRFGHKPMDDYLAEFEGPPPACLPLDDKMFAEDLGRAPLLIELLHTIPAHYTLLQHSIALAQEQSARTNGLYAVCGWLFGGATLKRTRSELTKRLDARYPQHRVYLRYFDPRVMPRLATMLAPINENRNSPNSSFTDLLGPVDVWCHLDGHGRLVRHDKSEQRHKTCGGEMRFDEKLSQAIDRIEACNLTIDELDSRPSLRNHRNDAAIDGYLLAAGQRGVHDQQDQVAYAWRAAAYGQAFINHPQLQDFILSALASGTPLEYFLRDRLPTFE